MKRFLLALIPAALLATAPAASAGPKGPTIVDVAIAANAPDGPFPGAFDTLITAVLAADPIVLDTLTGNGQFTVFAPTDEAFAKLGLNPDNIGSAFDQQTLTGILLYHVAHGRQASTSVTRKSQIRMLQFGFLSADGLVLTDNVGRTSTIQVPDVEAANGVIHGVSDVVLPFAP
ncbi:MAG: fasciclin domain-containing protein [Gammaproteobacteria bacterium]